MKTRILAIFFILLGAAFLVSITFDSKLAIYISIIAVGLALALQKYVASFFGYFIIELSKMMHVGDRIRIDSYKGDVRHIGLFHLTLDEVGEDEKLGGELTGKILRIPNSIVLDKPVLNFSKGCVTPDCTINCDYIFDEIRIPVSIDSDIKKAIQLLDEIIESVDAEYLAQAKQIFANNYPSFLQEAETNRRILIHVEGGRVWLKGKYVTPYKLRNELRTRMYLRFLEFVKPENNIKLA